MSNIDPNTTPFYELPLLGFDTETDGVDVKNSHVITCNITYDLLNGDFRTNDWLLKPQGEIPVGASEVHGITTEYAEENGMDVREGLQYIHDHMAQWEDYELPLVAFNAQYDCSLLTYEWRRHGIQQRVKFNRVIDPFVLDKKAAPFRKGNRKLGRLAEIYDVKLENAHSADADVLATLGIARKLHLAHPKSKLNLDVPVDKLHAQQVQWKAEQSASLQEYFRGKGGKPDAVVNGEWPVIHSDVY